MKRPSFQFYPGDWLRDMGLRGCSLEARGMWADLLCLMHDGVPYGHLATERGPWTDEQGARAIGLPLREYKRLLGELDHAGVFSRDPRGAIYSRRMVKDEELRQKRASAGSQGGTKRQANLLAHTQANHQADGVAEVKQLVATTATADEEADGSSGKGSGENQTGEAEILRALRAELPADGLAAFEGYRRVARFEPAFVRQVWRLRLPMTGGRAFSYAVIGMALAQMAANGEAFNVSRLAGYCRKIEAGAPPDRAAGGDDLSFEEIARRQETGAR